MYQYQLAGGRQGSHLKEVEGEDGGWPVLVTPDCSHSCQSTQGSGTNLREAGRGKGMYTARKLPHKTQGTQAWEDSLTLQLSTWLGEGSSVEIEEGAINLHA